MVNMGQLMTLDFRVFQTRPSFASFKADTLLVMIVVFSSPCFCTFCHRPMAGHKDVSEPRKVNAQSIILRETAGGYDVLLQLRSMSMKCMPGHLAALGGCRDRTDKDSRETALREVKEECGLVTKCVSKGPSKFAEGEKCDWYVIVLRSPAFEAKAKSRSECGDMKSVASLLPSSMQLADCYGHVWLPTSDLQNIDPKLPLMGGALNMILSEFLHHFKLKLEHKSFVQIFFSSLWLQQRFILRAAEAYQ